MGRIRTVKPELFVHSELFDAERETKLPLRLAFIALFTCCDREGRFKWRPRELKLACLPHDDVDFSRVLDALLTRGFVVRYASEYGCIPTWDRHQIINNRESESTIPAPTETDLVTRAPRVDDACPTPVKGKGREGKGRGKEGKESARAKDPSETKAEFIAACKAVVDADEDRFPKPLRQGFLDYWTETNASGKMRFQDQDFFDHGRRMDTWRKRAEKSGDIAPTSPPVILNANGKPQQLKPWVN